MSLFKQYKNEIIQVTLITVMGVIVIFLFKEYSSNNRLKQQLLYSEKTAAEQQGLAEELTIQLDKANREIEATAVELQMQREVVVELRDKILEKQQENKELELLGDKLAFKFEELKIDAEFKETQWAQKYDFLEQKFTQSAYQVEALLGQQAEKNQTILELETQLNQEQITGDRQLTSNDKAWLAQFLEKQQTRYNDWQSTKKSILSEVVKQGLLHELRDPLEDLLLEEEFLTQQEQRQLATWGINLKNIDNKTIANNANQDAEYAYTSLYDNTSTVEGEAGKVVNNEIQGSFRFKPQGIEQKVTPKLSLQEQEKQEFLNYYKQGLTQQAIETGESILERNPTDNTMMYNLSLLHVKRKEFESAKAYAQKLIELSAENHQGHYLQGLIAYYEQDIEQAKASLEKSITLNDKFGPAWLYFGHLLNYSKEHQEAKRAFEKVIEYQGESAAIYYNLAVLSQKVNKPKEGVYYYQKSLDLGGKIDIDLANKLLLSAQ